MLARYRPTLLRRVVLVLFVLVFCWASGRVGSTVRVLRAPMTKHTQLPFEERAMWPGASLAFI